MVLIHDIVEIDAGDTYAYDDAGHLDKREREVNGGKTHFRAAAGGPSGEDDGSVGGV